MIAAFKRFLMRVVEENLIIAKDDIQVRVLIKKTTSKATEFEIGFGETAYKVECRIRSELMMLEILGEITPMTSKEKEYMKCIEELLRFYVTAVVEEIETKHIKVTTFPKELDMRNIPCKVPFVEFDISRTYINPEVLNAEFDLNKRLSECTEALTLLEQEKGVICTKKASRSVKSIYEDENEALQIRGLMQKSLMGIRVTITSKRR